MPKLSGVKSKSGSGGGGRGSAKGGVGGNAGESSISRVVSGDEKWSPPEPGRSRIAKYLPPDHHIDEQRRLRPEDFYVAATDAKGHSEKTWLKLHPGMWNEILMLIARQALPYDTPQAFLRDAAAEHLAKCYLLENRGGVPNYMSRLRAISRIQQQVQQNLDFGESYRTVCDTARQLLANGQKEQAAGFLFDVLNEAKQIPEKAWRDMYVGMITRDWGPAIKGRPVKVMRPNRKSHQQEDSD